MTGKIFPMTWEIIPVGWASKGMGKLSGTMALCSQVVPKWARFIRTNDPVIEHRRESMSKSIVSIVCSLAVAAGASSASAQTVPGFLVETHASVSNPLVPSMRHDGVMFVGVNPPTNQLGLVSIVRIACIGSSVTLGPAILDPDVVLVDEV